MAVAVEVMLPEQMLLAAGTAQSEAGAMVRRELAASFFPRGVLSFGQARQLAELSVWDFLEFLRERKIALHYDKAELEEDLRTAQELS